MGHPDSASALCNYTQRSHPAQRQHAAHTADQETLLEGLDCGGFVIFHVEDGVEFGDLK
jgi:hypothetical protein